MICVERTYNELGQLTCVLCKTVVRSEDVWKVHINAKLHKQNIEQAKQLKQRTNNFTTATTTTKRPADPTPSIIHEQPIKRLKGILKNSTAIPVAQVSADAIDASRKNEIPNDFFDKPSTSNGEASSFFEATMKKTSIRQDLLNINRELLKPVAADSTAIDGGDKMEVDSGVVGDEALPEGFFDDPIKDAKARNLEYKDPVEEEWDKFQKEIKAAADFSNAIIAEDQEESTAERQIGEIDEQIRNWSRYVNLVIFSSIPFDKINSLPQKGFESGKETRDGGQHDSQEKDSQRSKFGQRNGSEH